MTSERPISYEPVTFDGLPDWAADDHLAAFGAFLNSARRLLAEAQSGPNALRDPPPEALLATCRDAEAADRAGRMTSERAKRYFEQNFVPHRVVHADRKGMLTGYYEPLLPGSRTKDARFRVPILRRPADLINLVDEAQRGAKSNGLTHARKTGAGIEPYAVRSEIELGALDGKSLELLYLEDPVDAFFMHVQGSGRIELPDGSKIRITYDGKNGHPYTSIGRYLIDTGLFDADQVSLDALKNWLKADVDRAREVLWQNKSYVFFRELEGEQAKAAMGVLEIPLTPGRSLAVDAGFHAIGTPVYVSAPDLMHATPRGGFHRLMIAQDVGSAIKGPERGDLYFGSGTEAGELAGITKHDGNYFVLLPRLGTLRTAGGLAPPGP